MKYEVIAYDYPSSLFEIVSSEIDVPIHREIGDLIHLCRLQKCQSGDRLPMPPQIERNLQGGSWRIDGDGWHRNMKKSLINLNQWMTSVLGAASPAAFTDFNDEECYQRRKQAVRERIEREAPARKLQQYFASESNMTAMCDLLRQSLRDTASGTCMAVIEPSFGDGRLLLAMLDTLRREAATLALTSSHLRTVLLAGVEIDPVIATIAMTSLAPIRSSIAPSEGITVHTLISDFLSTTQDQILMSPTPSLGCSTHLTIVVGSPPYTNGGGTGQLTSTGDAVLDTGRDLPLHFLVHSCSRVGLQADRVIFLLPLRCSKRTFIARAIAEMTAAAGSPFTLFRQIAADGEFEFAGRKVSQPAVIQEYRRLGEEPEPAMDGPSFLASN